MRPVLALLGLALALLLAPPARAHGTRSVTIDVVEIAPGNAAASVTTSSPDDRASVVFAAPCQPASLGDASGPPGAASAVACPGSIAGATLTVEGLGPILTEAIVLVQLHDGRRLSRVLTAGEPSWTIPEVETTIGALRGYVVLGVKHIATGYDHLLFLLSLVLLVRRPRAVILAETAFTVSHSLSFSATALGLVHVSAPAAEACIALSLVLVALDVRRAGEGPSARQGAALALVFGLVHGLGFAGGLSEIGLPDREVAAALAGFAIGVEIGQVALLAVALLALHALARRRIGGFEPALAALIGGVSSYWLVERTLACLASRG